jgi:hypothetical protein
MLNRLLNIFTRLSPNSRTGSFLRQVRELRWRLAEGQQLVYLEYPIDPKPRYGFGKPPHPLLNEIISRRETQYGKLLDSFEAYASSLTNIPLHRPDDAKTPYWLNGFFGGLEAVAAYCLFDILQPKYYLEIGSGNSTKFARRAVDDHHLSTRIISIDPSPRAEIDSICDEIIRKPLEQVDATVFDVLTEGDILVFDGSHRCLQNSDVTVFFLEILPKLRKGVTIYIDDIFLPYDYPPQWRDRFYSEQYVLAAMLITNPGAFEIVLPCVYTGLNPALGQRAEILMKHIHPSGVGGHGNGIWMRVN